MRADFVEHGVSSPKAGAKGDNDERDTTRKNARRLSANASAANHFVRPLEKIPTQRQHLKQ
jgi:hypothetical protein